MDFFFFWRNLIKVQPRRLHVCREWTFFLYFKTLVLNCKKKPPIRPYIPNYFFGFSLLNFLGWESFSFLVRAQWVGLSNNSYKPITNVVWVHAQFCKLQKRVHSTRSRKWYSLPVACPWSVVLYRYSGFFHH